MLPAELIICIFEFCHPDVFDNILKSNDTILMNYLTGLGLHKVLNFSYGSSNDPCIKGYEDICRRLKHLYIVKYTFKVYPYSDNNIRKIIPYNQKTYCFDYISCCSHLNVSYDEKNLPLAYRCDYKKLIDLEDKYFGSISSKSPFSRDEFYDMIVLTYEPVFPPLHIDCRVHSGWNCWACNARSFLGR